MFSSGFDQFLQLFFFLNPHTEDKFAMGYIITNKDMQDDGRQIILSYSYSELRLPLVCFPIYFMISLI